MTVPLYRNDSYEVIIDMAPDAAMRQVGIKVYGILNRHTGVVEMHVSTLPRAIQTAYDLAEWLKVAPQSRKDVVREISAQLSEGATDEEPEFTFAGDKPLAKPRKVS